MNNSINISFVSLVFNIAFSAYHLVIGIAWHSWWLLTLGTYYLILSIVRFFVLRTGKIKKTTIKFTGIMLVMLSVTVAGTVILSLIKNRGQRFPQILMIAMAVYAFSKITIAIINFVKTRKRASMKRRILRDIALANAFVSIFGLQRSMLVSFGEMKAAHIMLFNLLTGMAVWIIVLLLGINLMKSQHTPAKK